MLKPFCRLSFFLLLLFSLAVPFNGMSAAGEVQRPLRIAVADDYPPFTILGPDKQAYGLFVDMWKLWSAATGIPVEFQADSWSKTVEAVRNGTADVHSGLNKTEQRETFLDFSDPIHVGRSALYFRSGDTQPVPFEDLAGEKVGVVEGTLQDQYIQDKYPDVIRVPFAGNDKLALALLRGDVRAVFDETVANRASLARLGLSGVFQRGHETILTNFVYAGVAKGNRDLLDKINTGFKAISRTKLMETESRWLADDFDHFYNSQGGKLRLTPEEQAWLDTAPDIRMAVTTFINPVDIIDQEGRYSGMNADLLGLISQRIGVAIKPEFFDTWSEVVDNTLSGKVSGAMSFSVTPEREQYVQFTKPYAYDPVVIITKSEQENISSRDDLKGKTVSVIKGLAFMDEVKADIQDGSLVVVKDEAEALERLAAGETDAHVTTLIFYGNAQKKKFISGLKIAGSRNTEGGSLRIAVHKFQPVLFSIFNKALNSLTQEELAALRDKWLKPQQDTSNGVVLNTEESMWLRQNPISRIAVMNNWPPYDFTDEEGRHYGMHSDLLRLINKHLGTNLIVLPFDAWPEAYTKAASGEVDGILGLSWTKEREKTFLFSSAYYYEPASVLMRVGDTPIKEWKGLNGKTILVPKNTSIIDKIKAELPDAIVVEMLSKDDALTRLANGEGDAYVAWLSASPQKLNELGLTITAQIDDRQGEVTLGVPVSKPVLASIVQKGINSITQSEWAALREQWVPKAAGDTNLANLTNEEIQWIDEHKHMTVANEKDWPPFDFVESDMPKGLSIDLMKLVGQKLDLDVKFVNGLTWAELLERFSAGDIDVVPALYWTEERAKLFNFTKPYANNSSVLAVHQDRKAINSLAALKGHKVGVIKGFATAELLKTRYPEIKLVLVENALEGLQSVSLGKIDAYFDSIGVISYVLEKNVVPNITLSLDPGLMTNSETQLHMATLKSNAPLHSILQKGLDAVSPEEMRTIRNRWLPLNSSESRAVSNRVEFSNEEKAFIAAHPQLKLGVDVAWPPFEFVDKGVHKGISADVLEKISEFSGIELIAQTDLTWAQVLAGAKNGSIDIVPMLQPTPEREEFLDFTKPYVSYPIVIITRDDTPFISSLGAIGGLKTGMVSGYSIETMVKKHYQEIKRVPQTDLESMLKNLSSGKIDVALSNLAVATYVMNKLNLVNLRVTAPTEYNNDLSMGVPKGNPVLLSILQKSLDAITESEMNAIKNSWVALQVEFNLDLKTMMVYALPVLGGFIVIVGFVVVWNRKLGREVEERHEAERHSRMLLESVGEGIFGVDQFGQVTFVNSVASEALGYAPHELIGEKVHALIHHTRPDGSDFPVKECPMWEAYTKGKVSRVDDEILWRKDGTSFPVEYNATPLRRHDFIIGAVISFRDITKVQKATAALHEHLADVEKFNDLAVDRELRMIELKQEINALLKEKGAQEKYEIVQ